MLVFAPGGIPALARTYPVGTVARFRCSLTAVRCSLSTLGRMLALFVATFARTAVLVAEGEASPTGLAPRARVEVARLAPRARVEVARLATRVCVAVLAAPASAGVESVECADACVVASAARTMNRFGAEPM